MDINKSCALCNTAGAEEIVLSITSINSSGLPIGTSTALTLCPNCRVVGVNTMSTTAYTNIEAAILAV